MLKFTKLYKKLGTMQAVADELGINVSTVSRKLKQESEESETEVAVITDAHKIKKLEAAVKGFEANELTTKIIRTKIMGLSDHTPTPPTWLEGKTVKESSPGVPTLMCSDWHWAETIDPAQIGGVNKYDLTIAHQRVQTLISSTIDLLFNHIANPSYPGFVLALGGDMVSGNIHDELKATNEIEVIPAVLDLLDVLVWVINTLADKFGAVFVPCVTGNHGRNTHKIQAKERHVTSFDWMLYMLLEKHFKGDKRVTFSIPEGPDALYKVFNHKYLLSHGDQFRGGDSMIGCLGPVIRGDHKKRSRNAQVDMEYDTLIIGHWHQLIQMQRLIVNGSLCGYNEYAYAGNFGFEIPRQALWITHKDRGITFSMPVHADHEVHHNTGASWVSIPGKQ